MLNETIGQLSSHRAACKRWSIFLAVAILIAGGLGKLSTASLLWAASPLLLLALTEAGYAAEQGRCPEFFRHGKGDETLEVLPSESTMVSSRRFGSALVSISIWPFYLALWAVVLAGAFELPRHTMPSPIISAAETGSAVREPGKPVLPGTNNGSGYPQNPFANQPSGNPGMPQRTPGTVLQRPVTPVNYGARPPVRPQGPPPTVYYATPPPGSATPPVQKKP